MKISRNICVTAVAFVVFFCASPAFAAPNILNYQGTLTDDLNQPVTGSKNMIFRIYDVPAGGTALWSSTSMTVNVQNGLFNVAIEGFPEDLFSEDNRYMEVLVEGTVLSQRKRLASVPYAINAGIANSGGIPAGGIIMWSGAVDQIPEGWALCDGQNETPDLRDRFIVGAGGSYAVSHQGGKTQNNILLKDGGNHQHRTSWGFDGTHIFGWASTSSAPIFGSEVIQPADGKRVATGNVSGVAMRLAYTEGSGIHTHQLYEADTPNTSIIENRPPYFALCFIMKLP